MKYINKCIKCISGRMTVSYVNTTDKIMNIRICYIFVHILPIINFQVYVETIYIDDFLLVDSWNSVTN